jgi:hypothetical protein
MRVWGCGDGHLRIRDTPLIDYDELPLIVNL